MMFYIISHYDGKVTSGQLQRRVSELIDANGSRREEGMKHLAAIEHIEARGLSYPNEDYDVLSAAKRWCQQKTNETFTLSLPPKRERKPKGSTPKARQRVLLTGLDCLPGQLDLLPDLDGPAISPEEAAELEEMTGLRMRAPVAEEPREWQPLANLLNCYGKGSLIDGFQFDGEQTGIYSYIYKATRKRISVNACGTTFRYAPAQAGEMLSPWAMIRSEMALRDVLSLNTSKPSPQDRS